MKKLSKLMLAAVATAALAANAAAWDFGISGSVGSTVNQTNETVEDGAASNSEQHINSEGGAITITSSNKDGDHSADFSYAVNYGDGGLDEVLKLSGSKKAGDWTASAAVDYNKGLITGAAGTQGGENTPAITLTNGELTVKVGKAAHVGGSGGNGADSTASGNVGLGSSGVGVQAYTDSWQGVSVGMSLGDTGTATFGIQMDQDTSIFGRGAAHATQANYTTSGAGANVALNLGGTAISATYATGSTSENGGNDNGSSGSASLNTLGLNVGLDIGGISPYLSYGSFTHDSKPHEGSSTETKVNASAIGATIPMGSDSVVLSWTTSDQKVSTGSVESRDSSATGMELGYNTAIGPVTMKFGYGTKTVRAADGDVSTGSSNTWDDDGTGRNDGYKLTDIEVNLSLSF